MLLPPLVDAASNRLMRFPCKFALLGALTIFSGCHRAYVVPETPMPPNTILLSQMMRQLSARPGFNEAILKQVDTGGKKGTALLTPGLIEDLRKRILGGDWQRLDRFPGWTMREINPTVRVVGHVAGKNEKLEATSAVHPGAHPGSPAQDAKAHDLLDLGPYALDTAESVSLDEPSTLPGFATEGIVIELGEGVLRGDGPNDLASEHAESQRLADVLNRLAANPLDGAKSFTATAHGWQAKTPEQLIAALAAEGNTVTVDDARYFANFGHFHFKGEDVMMPFWIDTKIVIPQSGGRHLLVPAAHAEYEWHIHPGVGLRSGAVNADVSYYFGVDGKSEWRTMDTLDQPWVLKRNAHEYEGADAMEVTRLAGLMTIAYSHLHATHPTLPFGGYYALGVCQDGVSAIERKLTGAVTLFPNTADTAFFKDPRDAEINALMAAIPKDRDGKRPEPARIFGSLPTTDFDAITIPGLAADLNVTYAAWKQGDLNRSRSQAIYAVWVICGGALLIGLLVVRRKHRKN